MKRKRRTTYEPRAAAAGVKCKPPKKFNGWAHVRASVLEKGWNGYRFPVNASPIDGEALDENIHHAHIVIGDDIDMMFAAFRLREVFTTSGKVEEIAPPAARKKRVMWKAVLEWVKGGDGKNVKLWCGLGLMP